MAKKKNREELDIDKEINTIYRENCCNIQIDIFDIQKVFAVGRKAKAEGKDMKLAIIDFVESIRKN